MNVSHSGGPPAASTVARAAYSSSTGKVADPPRGELDEDGDQLDRLFGEAVGDLLLVRGVIGPGQQAVLDERGEPVGQDV